MSDCCATASAHTAASVSGPVEVMDASTALTFADRLGALRMRLDVGRSRYRVVPGLYRIGSPTADSAVLVTSNYKLTFDVVRSELQGLDVWLLVLDTKGINVWCAAGKQTFGTRELCKRMLEVRLDEVVTHRRIVLPQLGASGVAAHDVEVFTGFRVVYGPVRANDIPAFLGAGMKATPEMRRVTFSTRDRFVLTGVELSVLWHPKTLALLVAVALVSACGVWGFSLEALAARGSVALIALLVGLLGGGLVTPVLLPWLPFRAFSAKGALVGIVIAAALFGAASAAVGPLAASGAALALVSVASYTAMNFTGSSAITSPSGVMFEMRKALPWQIGGIALAVVLWIASAVIRRGF